MPHNWIINGKDFRHYYAELLAKNIIDITFLTNSNMTREEIKEIRELAGRKIRSP
jgi:hypothetical protein